MDLTKVHLSAIFENQPTPPTSFYDLPFDVKYKIACFSSHIWYVISSVDRDFHEYSLSSKGLVDARNKFGWITLYSSGNIFSFATMVEGVIHYAKSHTFYESECFQLWCTNSFSLKHHHGAFGHDTQVVKRDGQLFLLTEFVSDLQVRYNNFPKWHVHVHDVGVETYMKTRIAFFNQLPEHCRIYRFCDSPNGSSGFIFNWRFFMDSDLQFIFIKKLEYMHRDNFAEHGICVKKLSESVAIVNWAEREKLTSFRTLSDFKRGMYHEYDQHVLIEFVPNILQLDSTFQIMSKIQNTHPSKLFNCVRKLNKIVYCS